MHGCFFPRLPPPTPSNEQIFRYSSHWQFIVAKDQENRKPTNIEWAFCYQPSHVKQTQPELFSHTDLEVMAAEPCSCHCCVRHEGQAKSTGDFQTHLSGRLICLLCLPFGNSEWRERVCLLSSWGSFRPAWSQHLFVWLQASEKRKLSRLFSARTNRSVVSFPFHLLLGRKGEEHE